MNLANTVAAPHSASKTGVNALMVGARFELD
jgi:hypothetical protein